MDGNIQHGEGAIAVGPEAVLSDAGLDEQLVPAVCGGPEVPVPDAFERRRVALPGEGAEFLEFGRRRLGIWRWRKAEFFARGEHPGAPPARTRLNGTHSCLR